jgi:hypothetical protein
MMMAMERAGKMPAFAAPMHCPYYPGPALTLFSPAHALAAPAVAIPLLPRVDALQEFALSAGASRPGDSNAGRGPPALLLT